MRAVRKAGARARLRRGGPARYACGVGGCAVRGRAAPLGAPLARSLLSFDRRDDSTSRERVISHRWRPLRAPSRSARVCCLSLSRPSPPLTASLSLLLARASAFRAVLPRPPFPRRGGSAFVTGERGARCLLFPSERLFTSGRRSLERRDRARCASWWHV